MSRSFRTNCIAAALALGAVFPLAGQALPPNTGEASARQGVGFDSDEARVFLQTFRMISQFHSSFPGDSAMWEAAIDGLLMALDDPYATVFTPDEYGEFTESATGNYAGVGVRISLLGGRVTITGVFRETPAERAGLAVGDQIVRVEDEDATEWSLDQARDAIRGEPGSVVRLKVARNGFAELIAMSVERATVHVSAVAATAVDDVGYFAIDRIARGVADEMDNALKEFQDADAVILDLRRNPGGYLDESLRMADLFLAPGERLASADTRDPSGQVIEQPWFARSPKQLPDTPIIILVDEFYGFCCRNCRWSPAGS